MQEMRKELDSANQQLSTLQELTNKQMAKVQAAAAQEVQQYRQHWRDEFDKRRKLHNQVCVSSVVLQYNELAECCLVLHV